MNPYYIYGFKGNALFAKTVTAPGKEIGGIIRGRQLSGWKMFWRKL